MNNTAAMKVVRTNGFEERMQVEGQRMLATRLRVDRPAQQEMIVAPTVTPVVEEVVAPTVHTVEIPRFNMPRVEEHRVVYVDFGYTPEPPKKVVRKKKKTVIDRLIDFFY